MWWLIIEYHLLYLPSPSMKDMMVKIMMMIVSWPPHQLIWSSKTSIISWLYVFFSKPFYWSEWDNETDVGRIVDSWTDINCRLIHYREWHINNVRVTLKIIPKIPIIQLRDVSAAAGLDGATDKRHIDILYLQYIKHKFTYKGRLYVPESSGLLYYVYR